jgi:hypothetical protein
VYTKPAEPRSIGGVLDDGLRLWRESLPKTWPLALLAQLVVAVPLLVLGYKLQGILPAAPTRSLSAANAANAQLLLNMVKSPTTWLAYFCVLILSAICYTAIVLRVAAVATGAVSSLSDSLASAVRLLPRLLLQFLLFFVVAFVAALAAALLAGIGSAIGGGARAVSGLAFIILLLVFAFILGRVFLASIALMLEDAGAAESVAISWRLTRGFWWRCGGILMVLIIIGAVFAVVVGFVVAAIAAALGTPSLLSTAVTQIVSILANSVLGSLYPAVLVAILYDLKLRKEGADLLGRVDALARQ